ncbi:MAG: hypothetical protein ACXAC6_15040 [Candidatus Hodarchaeales archaeon]|jgi:hypothetical protein
MSENKLPLIFQTGRLNYIYTPLTIILIPLIGIMFFFNFADDPTIPSPLIPPLVTATFIAIGIIMTLFIVLKMKQKVTINEQQIEITTFLGSSTILTWEEVTSLEVTFTGRVNIIDDVGDLILAVLPSDPLGGVKIKLSSANKTSSISFMRIYMREVTKLIEMVNSITKVEPTGKKGKMKKSIWNWNFQT